MRGLAWGACTGGYVEHPSYDYEVGYKKGENGLEDGYRRGYENGKYEYGYDDTYYGY